MHRTGFAILLFTLTGCSTLPSTPPVMPSNQDFQVPANLANQFEERDAGSAPRVPVAPVVPTVAVAPAKEPEGPKGKKSKVKVKEKLKKDSGKGADTAKAVMPAEIPNRWAMPPFFKEGER